ncbi:cytochrome C [Dissulfurirhabdus thermomarina]|uniref:Cytochrome C n=1 Tax=Dissulfurirhabdus thermomarina TaxID=1765737 RepID=A0A6N9TR51_DISTH|nr:NapC/NirT family cytochrome c [Dissulfurirhabdus thermomarina]NDY42224.1 cytochrome C [Dissulfurirhabdus thermomarina]NMX23150.1 cytochrome C [Dissulfurirhabdus thermomarina]
MVKFTDIVKAFASGIAQSRLSLVGAIVTTVVAPVLLVSVILDIQGFITNPYFGFVIYLILGPLFIAGLVMVFVGLFFFRGREAVGLFTYEYLKEQFTDATKFTKVQKIIFLSVFLTILNILIVTLLSYSGYHYSESVAFCGQFCHTVMNPEYTAYQNSPHSRVKCVDCHIGEGAKWFVKAKLSGVRQLFAVAFNTYSRPIETPVHGLRPARETCEECHRPEFFHGDRLYIKDKFLEDEHNTHVRTVLLLKVGSGGYRGMRAQGIHWHVAPENRIVYRHADYQREAIYEVRLTKPDGTQIVFRDPDAPETANASSEGGERVMDCIDCHNRPTHVFLPPGEALDQKLVTGEIPASLPYIKREALKVITADYPSTEEAKNQIATRLRAWYKANYPDLVERNAPLLEQAIRGVQHAYTENVFPEMRIGWNTYKNFLGHRDDSGCFRCHNETLATDAGETISMDCQTCHVILAEDEPNPPILRQLQCPAE